mmetsp:Transcript_28127/g.26981  ORF Transcript_28127/g.26981 Transcript_28127/m.26981 type:complete len:110 (-) Transcript_28127:62-391(-)
MSRPSSLKVQIYPEGILNIDKISPLRPPTIGVQTRSSSKRNRETVFANVDNVKINWGEDAENKDEGRVKLTSKKHRRNAIIPNGVEALAVREVSLLYHMDDMSLTKVQE